LELSDRREEKMTNEEKLELFNSLDPYDFQQIIEGTAESLAEFAKETGYDEVGYSETILEYTGRIISSLQAIKEKMEEEGD
jgi:hypothetical protein